jgi:site-specific DNA-cytosine methylase
MFRFTTADFCSGGGLAATGIAAAGGVVKFAVDNDRHATACYRANFPDATVLMQNMETVTISEILLLTGLKAGQFDHMHISWSCKRNSSCNVNAVRNPTVENNKLLFQFIENFVIPGQPRTWTAENVDGALRGKRLKQFEKVITRLASLKGYKCKVRVLNAANYDVGQQRMRVIIKAVRLDVLGDNKLVWPKHSGKIITLQSLLPGVTKFRSTQFQMKEHSANQPIHTLTASDSMEVFDTKWRKLTIPEYRLLMGVPPEFILPSKSRVRNIRILGNGVPPPMMHAVMNDIVRILKDYYSRRETEQDAKP